MIVYHIAKFGTGNILTIYPNHLSSLLQPFVRTVDIRADEHDTQITIPASIRLEQNCFMMMALGTRYVSGPGQSRVVYHR